jgi:hypothetical protein
MTATARLLLLTLLLVPLTTLAQTAPATATPAEWDALSPAQRELLIAPLKQRWNASPGDRIRMLEHARRWQAMAPQQRARARSGIDRWERMPPRERAEARALFQYMRGRPEPERKAFLAEWRGMTPQQKADWLSTHRVPQRRDRD